jgi:hypothetical protein
MFLAPKFLGISLGFFCLMGVQCAEVECAEQPELLDRQTVSQANAWPAFDTKNRYIGSFGEDPLLRLGGPFWWYDREVQLFWHSVGRPERAGLRSDLQRTFYESALDSLCLTVPSGGFDRTMSLSLQSEPLFGFSITGGPFPGGISSGFFPYRQRMSPFLKEARLPAIGLSYRFQKRMKGAA